MSLSTADHDVETYEHRGFIITMPVRRDMDISDQIEEDPRPVVVENPIVEEAFSEMIQSDVRDGSSRLLVVLDAANIGYAYGIGNGFDVAGVENSINYFAQASSVTVTAFIPAGFLRKRPTEGSHGPNAMMQTDEWERLNRLVLSRVLIVVPAGDDDDAYALHYARSHNGFIVSNDFFVNHIKKIECESIRKSMEHWLAINRCSYTFSPDGQLVPNPNSELSRIFPLIQTHLSLPDGQQSHASSALMSSLASLNRAVESLVVARRAEPLVCALMARLSVRLELCQREGCLEDCQYILHLDSTNLFAAAFMKDQLGLPPPPPPMPRI